MTATMIVLGVAALYAFARGFIDLKQRRYALGSAGLLCGILCATLLVLTPMPTHAVKLDLSQAGGN